MNQSDTSSGETRRPRVTVAAIAERDGRFLCVEERGGNGALVINQPAGHVEGGETLLEAVVRETFEETGYSFHPEGVVGLYLGQRADGNITYLRIAIAGRAGAADPDATLDADIHRVLWLSREELLEQAGRHRSPMVIRCLDDYLAGERYPLSLLKSLQF
jgi:ADP-ribose pyrophosphatase YjhB (NUDIX family)